MGRPYPILQELDLKILDHNTCHALNSRHLPFTSKMMCAANLRSRINQSGCHGDSGGPFVCQQNDGSWKLHGAVSWGSPQCNASDAYTVFARLSVFRSWIDQYINS